MTAPPTFTDSEKKTIGCFLALLLAPLSWFVIAAAARDGWNGIIAPFFSLPTMTIAQMFAMRICVSVCLRVRVPEKHDPEKRDPWWAVRLLFACVFAYAWVHVALYLWGAP